MSDAPFEGKTLFITGAGAGIGFACARAFADAGARRIAIMDLSEQSLETCRVALTERGVEALCFAGDVSSAKSVEAAVTQIDEAWGRLDIAVNNAGISAPIRPVAETEEVDYDRLMSVNLKGVWLCMREELKIMSRQQSGSIINMASALSARVYPGASFYVASKFAVAGLTRTAAVEYATQNIRINAVCPGNVLTPLLENSTSPEQLSGLAKLQAMKRLGTPEEIGEAVVWLSSERASFCTGTLLAADGGWTAG
ncbi:MAG: SDR family NAD(P)-dependent oxidoreductase [Chromatocurvus sp.]